MPEQKFNPQIENEIREKLSGDLQKNALDFVVYIKERGMTTDEIHPNVFRYHGEAVCVLALHPNYDENIGWNIYLGDYDSTACSVEYENFPIDKQLKEFAWSHKHTCGKCGCDNQPGKRFKILGKEFDNVCTSLMWFGNASSEELEKLIKLVDLFKLCIDNKQRTLF